MKEVEIAEAVTGWLIDQHWECYFEVQVHSLGRVADIVAVRGPLVYIIECKNTLSLRVLQQASLWRSHLRSIAVPKPKPTRYYRSDRDGAYQIAKNCLEIGIIEVSGPRKMIDGKTIVWDVEEVVRPKLKRDFHRSAQRIRQVLSPDHKTFAPAGSAGRGHWTPYKSTMRSLQHFIRKNPGCTFKEIGDALGRMHYSNLGSAIGNLRKALVLWEKDWCFVDKSSSPHRCYIREDHGK